MPFPNAKRVIYKKNTLQNVICQLRFPPILRIDSEVPSQFQEKIRSIFPFYQERKETIQLSVPSSLIKSNPLISKPSNIKNHEFLSDENGSLKVNLNRTFMSLSTNNYNRWEDFKETLHILSDALFEIYTPIFVTRVGLRYINIFDKNILGIENAEWNELFKPQFLGLLSSEFRDNIEEFESIYEVNLADNISKVRILVTLVQKLDSNDKSLLVDSDFYSAQKFDKFKSLEKLDFLHARTTGFVRYIISDKLHKAMEPEEI